MRPRIAPLLLILAPALVTLSAGGCRNGELLHAANPVNVVLIVVDTLRPDVLGCYGDPHGPSPAVDGLAADGVLFESAVAPSPITGPSHASLFTSRWPSELGVVNNALSVLPGDVPVLAELLQRAGYHTGAAIAIAPVRPQWGFGRGFDVFEDRLQNSSLLSASRVMPATLGVLDTLEPPFFLWSHLADPHEPYNAHGLVEREAEVVANGRAIGVVSTSSSDPYVLDLKLTRGANELLIRSAHPFMVRRLSMRRRGWIKPTIEPARPPAEYATEYRATITSWRPRRVKLVIQASDQIETHDRVVERYRREVAHADRHVARLLARLRDRGLYDDTLIVFTADHGEGLGCHGYEGHVETLYDCMVRVPLIIKPARGAALDSGRRRLDLAGLVDVLPTILGHVGLAVEAPMRGRDLLAHEPRDGEPALFMETHPPQAARTLFGLRGARHTVILDAGARSWELYDTVADPGQQVNLFNPDDPLALTWQRRLHQRLRTLAASTRHRAADAPATQETLEMLHSLGYI